MAPDSFDFFQTELTFPGYCHRYVVLRPKSLFVEKAAIQTPSKHRLFCQLDLLDTIFIADIFIHLTKYNTFAQEESLFTKVCHDLKNFFLPQS